MRGILRSVSNASKASTNSSDFSTTYSEPKTPPATPERRPSHGAHSSDECYLPPIAGKGLGLQASRRSQNNTSRVAWDLRQVALPPPLTHAQREEAMACGQSSPLLPEIGAPDGEMQTIALPQGATFSGCAIGERATGVGEIRYANGDRYTGDVLDGFAHGYGIYLHAADETSFRGRFEAGRQAQGMQKLERGYTFDGAYQGNAAHGPGLLFDGAGFVLRAGFVDGQPHGPGHVHYRSGESYLGAFHYGRQALAPGVVRYPDGRVALRVVRHGVASLEVIARAVDGVMLHHLVVQEQAIAEERWLSLLETRESIRELMRRSGCVVLKPALWLLPWEPDSEAIHALSGILAGIGESPGANQQAMRQLVRGLLHLLGPARPYMTVGDIENATEHTPKETYRNMLDFVVDTVLPHCGTSRIFLGSAPRTDDVLLFFAYRLDGEQGYAMRLKCAVQAVTQGLCQAFVRDRARGDKAGLGHSRMVLCSVLDGRGRFDVRLFTMRQTLVALGLNDGVADAPADAQQVLGAVSDSRPPAVVAPQERGSTQRWLRAQSAVGQTRARLRSSSLGSQGMPSEAGRLSPMIEVADSPHQPGSV